MMCNMQMNGKQRKVLLHLSTTRLTVPGVRERSVGNLRGSMNFGIERRMVPLPVISP